MAEQRVGKPGGHRDGDAFYPTWRAGSKFWRLAQNKAYYAVLAVQVSFHFARHSAISAAPEIWQLRRILLTRRASPTRGGGVVLCRNGAISDKTRGAFWASRQFRNCGFSHCGPVYIS